MSKQILVSYGLLLLLSCNVIFISATVAAKDSISVKELAASDYAIRIDDYFSDHYNFYSAKNGLNITSKLYFKEVADDIDAVDVVNEWDNNKWNNDLELEKVKGDRFATHNSYQAILPLALSASPQRQGKYILYLQTHAINLYDVRLYEKVDGKYQQVMQAGSSVKIAQRAIKIRHVAFPIEIDNTAREYLLMADNRKVGIPVTFNMILYEYGGFNSYWNDFSVISALIYAASFVILTYNVALYISLRASTYLYYLVVIISMLTLTSVIDGSALATWLRDYPQFQGRFAYVSGLLYGWAVMMFTFRILGLEQQAPHLNWILKIFKLTFVFFLPFVFIYGNQQPVLSMISQILSSFYIMFIFHILFVAIRRKIYGAIAIVFGETCLSLGGTVHVIMMQGYAPINDWTMWSIQAGYLGEIIFLSYSVAQRLKVAMEDKIILEQQRNAAESAAKAKSQFFASMSHELRTPLTAILGYAEIAKSENISERDRVGHIKSIEHGGKHLLQLINDILDLSKIEAQKLDIEYVETNVFTVCSELENYFSILAKQKNIEFAIQYEFPLPAIVMSDPLRLKQCLINLCGNSIKFTEKGGVVVSVTCEKEKEILSFAVKDTGIGMTPSQASNLFSAFGQADKSTARNFGGTGLGLHLSKQIAEKLGSDITVESEEGIGSTFIFALKTGPIDHVEWLTAVPESLSDLSMSIAIPQLRGHILYAEDNKQNQQLISQLVEQTGVRVDVASNGKKALEMALQNSYDLLLTDIRIPIIDGIELMQLVTKSKPTLPVVAITATLTDAECESFKEVGFKQVLRKPLDKKSIYGVLIEFLTWREDLPEKAKDKLPQSEKIKVLLADDNPVNQKLIAFHIQQAGADVIIASDGLEAIALSHEHDIQLILMDMEMPNMDGMTAVRHLREEGFNVPIYALTANESEEAMQICRDAGCNGHLSKPLNTTKLHQVILGLIT